MFLDYDNDGDLDCIATNGWASPHEWGAGLYPEDQDIFLLNHGDGTFGSIGNCVGVTSEKQGRGLLLLDHDNDGDLDVLVVNRGSTPTLYERARVCLTFMAASLPMLTLAPLAHPGTATTPTQPPRLATTCECESRVESQLEAAMEPR